MRTVLVAAALLAGLSTTAMAQDYYFDFSYSAAGGPSGTETGSGTFVATATGTSGQFDVVGISGSANGEAITGLSSYASADQILYTAAPYVDFSGISFGTAGGPAFNLYSNGGQYVLSSQADPVGYSTNGSPAVLSVNQVPEPASLPLLAAGLFGLATLTRGVRRA